MSAPSSRKGVPREEKKHSGAPVLVRVRGEMPSPKMEFHYRNKGVQKEAPEAVFVTGDPRRQYDEVFETRQALGASIHWFPAYNDGVQGEVRSCAERPLMSKDHSRFSLSQPTHSPRSSMHLSPLP